MSKPQPCAGVSLGFLFGVFVGVLVAEIVEAIPL